MDPGTVCTICDVALQSATSHVDNVRQKGLKTLIAKSKTLGDTKWEIWSNSASLMLHSTCRKWYLSASIKSAAARAAERKFPSTSSAATSSRLSASAPMQNKFNFRDLCLICGKPWDRAHKQGYLVQHDYMKQRLLDKAEQRKDSIAIDVIARLEGVESLVAVSARYHKKCNDSFSNIPSDKSKSTSRAAEMDSAFHIVANHIIDSQKGKFTLTELLNVMGSRGLSRKVLYRKLMTFFGEDVHILQQRGFNTLILYKCFSIAKLCGDWSRDPNSLDKKQKKAIVHVAAEVIRKATGHDVRPGMKIKILNSRFQRVVQVS